MNLAVIRCVSRVLFVFQYELIKRFVNYVLDQTLTPKTFIIFGGKIDCHRTLFRISDSVLNE